MRSTGSEWWDFLTYDVPKGALQIFGMLAALYGGVMMIDGLAHAMHWSFEATFVGALIIIGLVVSRLVSRASTTQADGSWPSWQGKP